MALRVRQFVAVIGVLLAFTSAALIADENSGDWRELIPTIDSEAAVVGEWTKVDGALRVAAIAGARLPLAVNVGSEYDFRVRFTRETGVHSIALIFPVGDGQAAFDIDGWGQHLAGLQLVDGKDMRSHSIRSENVRLENGREYTALVEVRDGQISGSLDGKQLWTLKTDGSNLRNLSNWRLPSDRVLGLGAWEADVVFHSVEIRNLSSEPATEAGSPTSTPPLAITTTPPARAMERQRAVRPQSSQDDISSLSDEFDDPSTISQWLRLHEEERTGADQVERLDIGRTTRGAMTIVPYTSSWYQEYRGVLIHKRVSGDFVVSTRIRTTGRSGRGAPNRSYSLAGIMIRAPRNVTPLTWQPGGENYIFLSTGTANSPGTYQFEVKTTRASRSDLSITPANGAEESIRVVRIGSSFVLLRRNRTGQWIVHQRYSRPDLPEELQVGITVYTDWDNVQSMRPEVHNRTVIRNGRPDLIATVDYLRFARPNVPSQYEGRNLADPNQISDAEVVRLFAPENDE